MAIRTAGEAAPNRRRGNSPWIAFGCSDSINSCGLGGNFSGYSQATLRANGNSFKQVAIYRTHLIYAVILTQMSPKFDF